MSIENRKDFLGAVALRALNGRPAPRVVLEDSGEGGFTLRLQSIDDDREIARRVTFDEVDYHRFPINLGRMMAETMLAELKGGGA